MGIAKPLWIWEKWKIHEFGMEKDSKLNAKCRNGMETDAGCRMHLTWLAIGAPEHMVP